jgi:hypothetical protein
VTHANISSYLEGWDRRITFKVNLGRIREILSEKLKAKVLWHGSSGEWETLTSILNITHTHTHTHTRTKKK